MNETQEYYAVKNNSCHTFTIETYNGGDTWHVAATGNEHREAWLAEAELENVLMDRGYQVFYSIEEAEDFLREMDREDYPAQPCDETPEEKELLNEIEFATLLPGDAIYYDGDDWFIGNDGCQQSGTICLVTTDTQCELVSELGQWVRRDALDAIRSLHERLTTV